VILRKRLLIWALSLLKLLNLLNNSFYAVKDIQGDKLINVFVKREETSFIITVEDNGVGVSQDIQDKIMQPFFTTKSALDGTGLGLSISKGLLEVHGGSLNFIKSESGAKFEVHIPLIC